MNRSVELQRNCRPRQVLGMILLLSNAPSDDGSITISISIESIIILLALCFFACYFMCFRRWFKRHRLDLLNPEELKEVQVLSQQHQQQLQAG